MTVLKHELERHIKAAVNLYALETCRRVCRLELTRSGTVSVIEDEAPGKGPDVIRGQNDRRLQKEPSKKTKNG